MDGVNKPMLVADVSVELPPSNELFDLVLELSTCIVVMVMTAMEPTKLVPILLVGVLNILSGRSVYSQSLISTKI